ncbi:hypothetical protein [Algirhabdus cladophorae]|uniref:hypothetical protein n=1 Tax=Algirhabdus cladophorae TaxID=3377108 RepID=UPI003B847A92
MSLRDDTVLTICSLRCLVAVGLMAVFFTWPLLLHSGNPFLLSDSFVYIDQGERVWQTLGQIASNIFASSPAVDGTTPAPSGVGQSIAAAAKEADSIRSLPYVAFVGAVAPLGLYAVIWSQIFLVLVFAYAMFQAVNAKVSAIALVGGAVVMATLTSLPFAGSLLMPDVLGAIIVLFGLILVHGFERFDLKSQIILCAVAVFATFTHYGNIPLAAAVILGALILRAARSRRGRRGMLMGLGALAIVIGGNVAIGAAIFGEISVTPRRFPILLARSIEDGPALWHLEEHCAERQYAVCTWFGDDIPNNVGDALWNERGMEHAPSDLYQQIRDQELSILWAAFKEYPLQQIGSLGQNMVTQLTKLGVNFAQPKTTVFDSAGRRRGVDYEPQPLRARFDVIKRLLTLCFVVSLAYLLLRSFGKRSPDRELVILMVLALICNAAIFGGLSAPVDRYQSRIAWLVPLLAMALYFSRNQPAKPQ